MNNIMKNHIATVELTEALDIRTLGMLKQEDGSYLSSIKQFFTDNVKHVFQDSIDKLDGKVTNRIVAKENLKQLGKIRGVVKTLSKERFSKYSSQEFPVVIGMNMNHLEFSTAVLKLDDYVEDATKVVEDMSLYISGLISNVNDVASALKINRYSETEQLKWKLDKFIVNAIGVNNNNDKLPFSKLFPNMSSLVTIHSNYTTINEIMKKEGIVTFNAAVNDLQNNVVAWLDHKASTRHSKEVISYVKDELIAIANIISFVGMISHLVTDNTSYFYNIVNELK